MEIQDFLLRLTKLNRANVLGKGMAPLRSEGAPIVEACHIQKHADCGINSLDNGIALCANLHLAFDYGLISLSDDYHVIVKQDLKESETAYSLKSLDGKKIRLPKQEKYWPGREWVRGQRNTFKLLFRFWC